MAYKKEQCIRHSETPSPSNAEWIYVVIANVEVIMYRHSWNRDGQQYMQVKLSQIDWWQPSRFQGVLNPLMNYFNCLLPCYSPLSRPWGLSICGLLRGSVFNEPAEPTHHRNSLIDILLLDDDAAQVRAQDLDVLAVRSFLQEGRMPFAHSRSQIGQF